VTHAIDVIIPNYNGVALLTACLDSLRGQTRRDFRVLVVDDASSDDSLAVLRERYPEVAVLALPSNGGFVRAVNAGIAHSAAPIVVLLNNDTVADPRFIEQLAGALDRYPQYAFAAAKLRLFDQPDRLHSAGDGYGWDGVPFSRGVWQPDAGQYDALAEVFGPCAGAAAYRRAALAALADQRGDVLDAGLGMYCEDVDLNLRARRAGLRTIFVPQATVLHHLSATGGGVTASYGCGRNFIVVWAKNLPPRLLLRSLPRFALAQLRITLAALRHIRGAAARARLRGQWAGLKALPAVWRERRFAARESTNLSPWIGR
jgi:GT2 family glycosyltransferase